MRRWLALLPLACGFLAAAAASAADPSWTADERAVAAADEAFFAASQTRHGQAWADYADDTATLQGAHGKAAIGEKYTQLYAQPGFTLSWHPAFAKVVGDLGVTSGSYEMHRQDAQGQDRRSAGSYMTVWHRQPDGQWLIVWDGGTEDK